MDIKKSPKGRFYLIAACGIVAGLMFVLHYYLGWNRGGGFRIRYAIGPLAYYLMVVVAVIVFAARSIHIDEKGITVKRGFGITQFTPWEKYAFVGPAYSNRGGKYIYCSRTLPVCGADRSKYTVSGDAVPLEDSPAMREALRRFCPIYSEEYESGAPRSGVSRPGAFRMKVLGSYSREKLWIYVSIVFYCWAFLFFGTYLLAPVRKISFGEYIRNLSPLILGVLFLIIAGDVFLLTRIVEYEIGPEGVVGVNALGRSRLWSWTDFSFIGTVRIMKSGAAVPSILCAKDRPQPCRFQKSCTRVRLGDIALPYSSALEEAIKGYRPDYSMLSDEDGGRFSVLSYRFFDKDEDGGRFSVLSYRFFDK